MNKLTGYEGSVLAFIARFRNVEGASADLVEMTNTLKGKAARRIAQDLLRKTPKMKVSKAIIKWALPSDDK